MRKYIFGRYFLTGGSYDGKTHTHFYDYVPASFYWWLLCPLIRVGRCGYKGAYFRYNDRFFEFFWKPLCPGYFDKDKVWHKSKTFQFLTFRINELPQKEKPMNDKNNLETTVKVPAFDDTTIAALMAEKTLAKPDGEILVQTEEDYEGTDAATVKEPTIH